MTILAAIAALSQNNVIGNNNGLPWHLPADLQNFKALTLNHSIIMGRKTYESIGKPLPQRENIVVTKTPNYSAPGCIIANDFKQARSIARDKKIVFVIGGAQLYKIAWPYLTKLYLTIIHADFVGNVFFPSFNWKNWREVNKQDHNADAANKYAYSFIELDKIKD